MERDMLRLFYMLRCERRALRDYLLLLADHVKCISEFDSTDMADDTLLQCKVQILEMDNQRQQLSLDIVKDPEHQTLVGELQLLDKNLLIDTFNEFDSLTETVNGIKAGIALRQGQADDLIDKSNEILLGMLPTGGQVSVGNRYMIQGEPVC
jgi:hypothetical protein